MRTSLLDTPAASLARRETCDSAAKLADAVTQWLQVVLQARGRKKTCEIAREWAHLALGLTCLRVMADSDIGADNVCGGAGVVFFHTRTINLSNCT